MKNGSGHIPLKRPFDSAAAQLLDREAPEAYLREWASVVAAEPRVVETDFKSILVFKAASEWFGLPTKVIEEVAEPGTIRRLPHRTGTILRGIVTLRGEVVVCVSLEVLLGLESREGGGAIDGKMRGGKTSQAAQTRMIVCNGGKGRLAFIAGDTFGVMRYVPRELREVPATVAKSGQRYTAGILPWRANQTIGCLDAELVFHALNKGLS